MTVAANAWRARDRATERREFITLLGGAAALALLNGRMYVLGGEAYLNDLVGTYRTHEAFDPKTNAQPRPLAARPISGGLGIFPGLEPKQMQEGHA